MTLGEKIQYYRKKNKLSQEELAARVGVSRQAVSKWELGDATPELDKLVALARAFGVTTDELLSPGEPEEAPQGDGAQGAQEPSGGGYADGSQPGAAPPPPAGWHGLGFLERLIRRWGWLAGVYIALSGLGLTIVGALARFAFSRMFAVTASDVLDSMMGGMLDGTGGGWTVSVPDGWEGVLSGMADTAAGVDGMGQVTVAIATAILVIGVVTMAAGVVLAVWLYRRGRNAR